MIFNMETLNKEQQLAVDTIYGPVLIMAGAGSGKTKTLISRIDHMIAQGIQPSNILAITFTNKAAKELVERLSFQAKSITASTIHSLCVNLLRGHIKRLGYTSDFTVIDTEDAKTIINYIKSDIRSDIADGSNQQWTERQIKDMKTSTIQRIISLVKSDYHPNKVDQQIKTHCLEEQLYPEEAYQYIFHQYQQYNFENALLDFDDLLIKTVELLKTQPDILKQFQQKYQYIMVDEYQDVNGIQNEIVRLLVGDNQNLCVVGDPDQSIYKFRGAKIKNIINFNRFYPNAKVIYLHKNYRSRQNILDVANDVINKNEKINNMERYLVSNKSEGKASVVIVNADNEYKEADGVASLITSLKQLNPNAKNKDFVVLYRNNYLNTPVQRSLKNADIPYYVNNGINFYQRKEVKDMVAYLNICVNPHVDLHIKRVINTPARYVGAKTIQRLEVFAKNQIQPLTLATTFSHLDDIGIKGKTRKGIEAFLDLYRQMPKENNLTLTELFDYFYVASGYNDLVNQDEDYDENVLVEFRKEFEMFDQNQQLLRVNIGLYDRLSQFLQQLALQTNSDTPSSNDDRVQLMTIHSAKGLEFPYVFVVGCEEGIFPSGLAKTPEDIEEERRLAYVAITRAKNSLILSHCKERCRFGEMEKMSRSRFLDEINQETVKTIYLKNN